MRGLRRVRLEIKAGEKKQRLFWHVNGKVTSDHTYAKIPETSRILVPQKRTSGILKDLGSYIFIFRGILAMLDPVAATLQWDSRDLGSWTK